MVDKRLLALNRMPETVYERLRIEEAENQNAFHKTMIEAKKELDAQEIPERIKRNMVISKIFPISRNTYAET